MTRVGMDRIWTIPNVISFARLLSVPIFLWLLIAGHDGPALTILIVATTSDFIDGQIARRYDQVTRLGMYLDPASDRLFIAASVIGLTVRGLIPVVLLAVVLARDVLLLAVVLARRLRIHDFPRVTYIGKTATFVLFTSFPVIVLGTVWPDSGVPLEGIGWTLGTCGAILYWIAGMGYLRTLLSTKPGAVARSSV